MEPNCFTAFPKYSVIRMLSSAVSTGKSRSGSEGDAEERVDELGLLPNLVSCQSQRKPEPPLTLEELVDARPRTPCIPPIIEPFVEVIEPARWTSSMSVALDGHAAARKRSRAVEWQVQVNDLQRQV